MTRLNEESNVDLFNSNGDVIYFDNNSVLISVDIPNDEEIRMTSKGCFTSENCMFDNRTVDYICGLLSPTEYKMPKKKHRKSARIKKKLRKTQGIVLRMEN